MYFISLYASIMSGRTLYVGSSHLVPVEMVWPPQVFTHYPGWERQARRRVLAADLPPGTLDVKGGRTVAETIPRYRQVSKSLATWRAVHPYPLTRAIILLGGNDLVTLTEEYLKDSRVSRKKCLTLIADPKCYGKGQEQSPLTSSHYRVSCSSTYPMSTSAQCYPVQFRQPSVMMTLSASSTCAWEMEYHQRSWSGFMTWSRIEGASMSRRHPSEPSWHRHSEHGYPIGVYLNSSKLFSRLFSEPPLWQEIIQ